MAEVVSLDDHRKRSWDSGEAKCISCGHEWVAVAPSRTEWLECPDCGSFKGKFRFSFSLGQYVWECDCGNTFFEICENGVYCPNCGEYKHGWEELCGR